MARKVLEDQQARPQPETGNGALADGWCWGNVGQLCIRSEYGTSVKCDYSAAGPPVLRIPNIAAGRIDLEDLKFATQGLAISDDSALQRGDMLMCRTNGSIRLIGKAAVVRSELPVHHAFASYLLRFRFSVSETLPLWVHLYVGSPHGRHFIESNAASSAGQHNISLSLIHRLPLPLAPLNEQRRIVAKIEELFSDLDAGVAALQRARANLKRYRASVLKSAVEGKLTADWRVAAASRRSQETQNTRQDAASPFEPASALLQRILKERRAKWEADQRAKFAAAGTTPPKDWQQKYVEPTPPDTTGLPELPDGWSWASVEQIAEVQGGIQKQPKRTPKSSAFPFLRVANVYRNRLELDDVHQIELFGDELDRLRLEVGDMLIVEGNGSKSEIGRSAIWNGVIEDCVHQNHIIRVRLRGGSPLYLNCYWNSPPGNGRVMEQAASTSGLYTLSVAKVNALPVPLPPLPEQSLIADAVAKTLSQIDAAEIAINNGLQRAARLRQSILKRAFEGKLVPQDPTDEPASVLLERIANSSNSMVHAVSKGSRSQIHTRKKRTGT